MSNKKQAWIDLVALSNRINWNELQKCVRIEHHDAKTRDLFAYSLRVALRQVGHKITRMYSIIDEDNNNKVWVFSTSIKDQEILEDIMELYDDWLKEVEFNDHAGCNCGQHHDESESESEPDENPSN